MARGAIADVKAHAENLFRLGRRAASVLRSCKKLGFKVSRKTIFNWQKDFEQTGTVSERKAGSGRKRRIKGTLRSGLVRKTRRKTFSARRWAVEHNVPRETVRRALAEEGNVARVRRKTPMLTAVNKQKRVDFAQHYGARSRRWWRNVTFTDSKYFGIGAAGRVFAWVDKGERPEPAPRPPREGPQVHVYVGLNSKGSSSCARRT